MSKKLLIVAALAIAVVVALGFGQPTVQAAADGSKCGEEIFQVPKGSTVSQAGDVLIVGFPSVDGLAVDPVEIDCHCASGDGNCWERYRPSTGVIYCHAVGCSNCNMIVS